MKQLFNKKNHLTVTLPPIARESIERENNQNDNQKERNQNKNKNHPYLFIMPTNIFSK